MKKFFILAAMAATAAAACTKNGSGPDIPSGRAEVGFTISSAGIGETRAAPVEADETRVNTVDAFVFNATGDLDAYGHYTGEDFTTSGAVTTLHDDKKLSCTTGAGKKVWIVINGNAGNVTGGYASGIKNESDLKSQVFLLTQNVTGETPALQNFQMIGSNTATFTPGNNSVNVEVSRVVARVWIKKIKKDFTSAAQNGPLTIKNIYMSNVVGSFQYDGTCKKAADDLWFNKYAFDANHTPYSTYVEIDQAEDLWLNRNLSPAVAINEDASKTTEIESTFYVMPNDVAWGTSGVFGPIGGTAWSPRHTRLIIETEYAGQVYYYGIPIAENGTNGYPIGKAGDDGSNYQGLKANYSYEIDELVLTRLGSTSPDEPVIPAMVNFNITVKTWTTQFIATETGKYVI